MLDTNTDMVIKLLTFLTIMAILIAMISAFFGSFISSVVNHPDKIKDLFPIIEYMILLLFGALTSIIGLFFTKFNFKNIINFIRYKKWINLNKKVINNIIEGKEFKKQYEFDKIKDNVSKHIYFYNEKKFYHYEKMNYGLINSLKFVKRETAIISSVEAIKYYQKYYGTYFYKLIGIDHQIIENKLQQINDISNLIKLSSNLDKYSDKDISQLNDKKEFLEKQLEEMMYLFNSKILKKPFKIKYINAQPQIKSKKINYKIEDVLEH